VNRQTKDLWVYNKCTFEFCRYLSVDFGIPSRSTVLGKIPGSIFNSVTGFLAERKSKI